MSFARCELTNRGLDVVPQIGVCGYRIDLGIRDSESPGRFICGIECDGVAYHSSQTARDRDRLRQQVLEGRGWEIHRVWSTDWFKDRQGQIERLLNLIEQSRQNAKQEYEQAKELIEQETLRKQKEVDDFLGQVSDSEVMGLLDNLEKKPYVRPVAAEYKTAVSSAIYMGQQLVDAPTSNVANAILAVVEVESPIHIKDLTTRVAAIWGQRTGTGIAAKIQQICFALNEHKRVNIISEFIWKPDADVIVRSRKETNIPAERIAPEEIGEAILQVLRSGHGFTRQELIGEVRGVFGFSRTGPALQQVIDSAIENLLSKGKIGEGSLGIAIRSE